jgi:hypothetical protein
MKAWKIGIVGLMIAAVATMNTTALAAGEDVRTVQAEGRGKTEKDAVNDAKRAAADQVGSEVISETIVENMDLIKDKIITKLNGYVHAYKVLSKENQGGDVVVKIEAQVSTKQMKEDARLLYSELGKPRVLVLITQVNGSDAMLSTQAENIVAEILKDKEFDLVDAATAKENIKKDEARAAAEGDAKAAAKIGLRSGAEVMIIGTTEVSKPEPVHNILYAAKSNMQIRAIRSDNARVLAVANVAENGIEGIPDAAPKKAVSQAAKKAAHELFSKVVKEWNSELMNGSVTELSITKGVDFGKLRKIKEALSKIDGVKSVSQRSFDAPSAVLDVTYLGDSEKLADVLSSQSLNGLKFEVQTVGGGKIGGELK